MIYKNENIFLVLEIIIFRSSKLIYSMIYNILLITWLAQIKENGLKNDGMF